MQFVCRVGTPEGRVVEQILDAHDESSARSSLEGKGFHVFEVKRKGVPLRLGLPSLRRRRKAVSDSELMIFNQELAGLLKAGLPLLQALDLMLERQRNPQFRAVLTDVRNRVRSGDELSEAFASYGDAFPPLYSSTLMAGERSGELESVIRRFVRYLRLVLDTRKRVVSALVYPAVLFSLSLIMILVMTIYVIPKFQDFYASMDLQELPLLTRIVLGGSVFLQEQGLLLAAVLVVLTVLFLRWRATAAGRRWVDGAKLQIPIVGSILRRFSLSEFCRSLSTLLAGGMPLVPCLEVSSRSVGNTYLRDDCRRPCPRCAKDSPSTRRWRSLRSSPTWRSRWCRSERPPVPSTRCSATFPTFSTTRWRPGCSACCRWSSRSCWC